MDARKINEIYDVKLVSAFHRYNIITRFQLEICVDIFIFYAWAKGRLIRFSNIVFIIFNPLVYEILLNYWWKITFKLLIKWSYIKITDDIFINYKNFNQQHKRI